MKKVLDTLLISALSVSLTGCGLFETFQGQSDDKPNAYSNVYELSSGMAYVWDHRGETDIRKDLSQDRVGDAVFFACPKGDINFKGDELSDIDQYPRSIWIPSDIDDQIPTVTSENALIYISDTTVPKEIIFERFADYGYSIGVSNMEADGGGHYYIVYAETDEDDYKYYVDMKSDAAEVTQFDTISRLYLDKVGGMEVKEESVSDGGTVLGLEKDKYYICEFYTGTFYQDFKLKAGIHSFGKLERFVCHDYEFLHANCIKIEIPEWFKSGYYFVQGVGLFRYVSDEDLKVYNGLAYDESIDWNDPIKQYDEYGVCIFDPSLDIGTKDIESISDPGLDESEIVIGASPEEEETEEGSEIDESDESNPLDSDSN